MKRKSALFTLVLLLLICSACSTDAGKTEEKVTIDELWEIEDEWDFVVELSSYIAEKCDYGRDMSALSAPERVFYITQVLEMEVNNGGFMQFFLNSSGAFSPELVSAFNEINAPITAGICQKAISAICKELPMEVLGTEDILIDLGGELEAELSECDSAFYEYEEDLTMLNYEYIMSNKEAFD